MGRDRSIYFKPNDLADCGFRPLPVLPLDWSIVMRTSFNLVTNRTIRCVVAFLLLLCPHTASAITYMSIETVPNRDVVGEDDVATVRSIGYANLERWSQRLLGECRVVDSVVWNDRPNPPRTSSRFRHGTSSMRTARDARSMVGRAVSSGPTGIEVHQSMMGDGSQYRAPGARSGAAMIGECRRARAGGRASTHDCASRMSC